MQITSLGQAGYLIDFNKTRFLIDPYLSNYVVTSGAGSTSLFSREFEPPFQPRDLNHISAIFITHDHADHCDPDTIIPILRNNPKCKIFGPQTAVDLLLVKGVSKQSCQSVQVYKPQRYGDVHFTAVPSAHYELQQNPQTGEYPFLGYVFQLDHIVLYHSGDTILYDGLVKQLGQMSDHIDICILPVNGRDAKREQMGITGNLEPAEAVWLAAEVGAKTMIPMHNDLFKINQREPNLVDDCVRDYQFNLRIQWLAAGEVVEV